MCELIQSFASAGGYVFVDELLERPHLRQYSVGDVEEVVRTSEKQRFKLDTESGRLKIKATQGHSKKVKPRLNVCT